MRSLLQDPESKRITDLFSFYGLESSVIADGKHDTIRAAYLFYYATESAFPDGGSSDGGARDKDQDLSKLRARLNGLIKDALIIAKQVRFPLFSIFFNPILNSTLPLPTPASFLASPDIR